MIEALKFLGVVIALTVADMLLSIVLVQAFFWALEKVFG
jgi:hypothetical protein